jgi:hypothetical protein
VLGSLDRGGAETWLMDIVRHADRGRLGIDVCLTGERDGAYAPELIALGGQIHRCPLRKRPLRFHNAFFKLLTSNHYDVVLSHLYYFSGVVLRAAAMAGVPTRIAHVHPIVDAKEKRWLRKVYQRWMRGWIVRYGTQFVSPTEDGLVRFWGPEWNAVSGRTVMYNGIKVDRFERSTPPTYAAS